MDQKQKSSILELIQGPDPRIDAALLLPRPSLFRLSRIAPPAAAAAAAASAGDRQLVLAPDLAEERSGDGLYVRQWHRWRTDRYWRLRGFIISSFVANCTIHPHIQRIHGFEWPASVVSSTAQFAEIYCATQTLREWLADGKERKRTDRERIQCAYQICRAIHHFHTHCIAYGSDPFEGAVVLDTDPPLLQLGEMAQCHFATADMLHQEALLLQDWKAVGRAILRLFFGPDATPDSVGGLFLPVAAAAAAAPAAMAVSLIQTQAWELYLECQKSHREWNAFHAALFTSHETGGHAAVAQMNDEYPIQNEPYHDARSSWAERMWTITLDQRMGETMGAFTASDQQQQPPPIDAILLLASDRKQQQPLSATYWRIWRECFPQEQPERIWGEMRDVALGLWNFERWCTYMRTTRRKPRSSSLRLYVCAWYLVAKLLCRPSTWDPSWRPKWTVDFCRGLRDRQQIAEPQLFEAVLDVLEVSSNPQQAPMVLAPSCPMDLMRIATQLMRPLVPSVASASDEKRIAVVMYLLISSEAGYARANRRTGTQFVWARFTAELVLGELTPEGKRFWQQVVAQWKPEASSSKNEVVQQVFKIIQQQ